MSAEDRDTELGWPFGRNKWPYVVGTEYVFGATVWGYEGGDANAVAWSGTSIAPLRYHFNADGDLDRSPVDVSARLREDLRLGGEHR